VAAGAVPGSYAGFSVNVMPPTYACCGSIPIAGSAESLNVAVAGAIALYEASRR